MEEITVRRRDLRAATEKPKKRKVLVPFLAGLGVAAIVPVVGSTLAANISLGDGSIEFGQGQMSALACDTSITVTPETSWNSVSSLFNLSQVTLADIAEACDGKTIGIQATLSDSTTVEVGSAAYAHATDAGTLHFYPETIEDASLVTGFILESRD